MDAVQPWQQLDAGIPGVFFRSFDVFERQRRSPEIVYRQRLFWVFDDYSGGFWTRGAGQCPYPGCNDGDLVRDVQRGGGSRPDSRASTAAFISLMTIRLASGRCPDRPAGVGQKRKGISRERYRKKTAIDFEPTIDMVGRRCCSDSSC